MVHVIPLRFFQWRFNGNTKYPLTNTILDFSSIWSRLIIFTYMATTQRQIVCVIFIIPQPPITPLCEGNNYSPLSWSPLDLDSLIHSLKSDSHLPTKTCIIYFTENPFKMKENAFYFIIKALFALKIFTFLSWLVGHVGKTAWLERQGLIKNSWRHNLVNKQLQYK